MGTYGNNQKWHYCGAAPVADIVPVFRRAHNGAIAGPLRNRLHSRRGNTEEDMLGAGLTSSRVANCPKFRFGRIDFVSRICYVSRSGSTGGDTLGPT